MGNHTPGPWWFDEEHNIIRQKEENGGTDGWVIAEVDTDCFSYNHNNQTDEPLANAHLIAAAPDMLFMLQTLECLLRHGKPNLELFSNLKDLIHRAEGGSDE